jgi:hypothetical protein
MNVDLLTLILGAVGGGSLIYLIMTIRDLQRQIDDLKATPKRLPYASADEIENAMAAILTLQYDVDIKREMIENALAHLRSARNPDSSKVRSNGKGNNRHSNL